MVVNPKTNSSFRLFRPAGLVVCPFAISLLHCYSVLDGCLIGFPCLYSHGALDRPHEDLTVAAIASMSGARDGLNNLRDHLIMRDDLDAGFLYVLDKIFDHAVRLAFVVSALLPPESACVRNSHPGKPFNLFQRVSDFA